ncbi:MAG TPA: hypothetical protein DDW22_03495 [Prevotellaceae bacterium]|nr:hypothetical protein [Prevotellaceae bacterium]
MKKLAFVFAAVVAVSFASCGNKTEQGCGADSDSVCCDTIAEEDTVVEDTAAADTTTTDTTTVAAE